MNITKQAKEDISHALARSLAMEDWDNERKARTLSLLETVGAAGEDESDFLNDNMPLLRAEIRRLNDALDAAKAENGELGMKLGLEIQRRTIMQTALQDIQHERGWFPEAVKGEDVVYNIAKDALNSVKAL